MERDLHISYENSQISSIRSTKFLGLEIDDNLSWHCHIDQMIHKLNKVTYVIRFFKLLLPFETLKMFYFSTFHPIISYGIIFWGISTYSNIIFKIQKRIVRIIMNSGNKDSHHNLFKILYMLTLQSQYILYLLICVVKNKDLFKTNSDIHSFNTRFNHDLHIPVANLAVFQKVVQHPGIKIYNYLPQTLKQLSHDIPKFKVALKDFFLYIPFTQWRNIIAGNKDVVS
jgi:hypothetical protein